MVDKEVGAGTFLVKVEIDEYNVSLSAIILIA